MYKSSRRPLLTCEAKPAVAHVHPIAHAALLHHGRLLAAAVCAAIAGLQLRHPPLHGSGLPVHARQMGQALLPPQHHGRSVQQALLRQLYSCRAMKKTVSGALG